MTVVAFGATLAVEGRVIGYEEGIGGGMACPAVHQRCLIARAGMALLAKNRAIIEICLVSGQAKFRQPIVLKRLQIVRGYRRFSPLMLGMTMAASAGIWQAAVQARPGDALFAYVSMAALAALGRAALPGHVTPGALSLEIGV